jgi:hypothetical protein
MLSLRGARWRDLEEVDTARPCDANVRCRQSTYICITLFRPWDPDFFGVHSYVSCPIIKAIRLRPTSAMAIVHRSARWSLHCLFGNSTKPAAVPNRPLGRRLFAAHVSARAASREWHETDIQMWVKYTGFMASTAMSLSNSSKAKKYSCEQGRSGTDIFFLNFQRGRNLHLNLTWIYIQLLIKLCSLIQAGFKETRVIRENWRKA